MFRHTADTPKLKHSHVTVRHSVDADERALARLAAPFAPFPAEIRKDTDLLVITRTWTFAPGDRLFDN